jgi:aminoglycoside phosphotransferase (APT) family kinase protein
VTGRDRDVLVVVHPDEPLVVDGDTGEVGGGPDPDEPPGWPSLLAAARRRAPDGAWPLGPHMRADGVRAHVVQARTSSLVPRLRWSEEPDPAWPDSLRREVQRLLDEIAGRSPRDPLRAPWMRRGWWSRAEAWADAQLAAARRRRSGELQPREHWSTSAVARIPATGGAVWLKAVPSFFRREPAVLEVLAERLPGRVPNVLAIEHEPAETRFLMEHAGTVPEEADEDDRPRLAALIADLQIRSLDLLPALRAACADRSPARLAAELARLTEHGFELPLLDAAERTELRRLLPELSDRLLALADGPLAEALVHGDFHPWNVIRRPGWSTTDAVVLDWTDAGIGPAAMDLTTLAPPGDLRALVTRAYAETWAPHLRLPVGRVEAAASASRLAAHVVQALAYDEILRSTEPVTRWPFSGVMARHLRAVLALGREHRSRAGSWSP